MFTGLVEETGVVAGFARTPLGWSLAVDAKGVAAAEIGESVAVNGCCLTVARKPSGSRLEFDLLEETRRVTGFSDIKPGDRVNLERSLRAGGLIGGHFVSGHIDCAGEIATAEKRGADTYLRVTFPPAFSRHVVVKGSIAIDGISLTVAEESAGSLAVWIIPHTLAVTTLRDRLPGARVNLEFDLLGKHVEKLLGARETEPGRGRG